MVNAGLVSAGSGLLLVLISAVGSAAKKARLDDCLKRASRRGVSVPVLQLHLSAGFLQVVQDAHEAAMLERHVLGRVRTSVNDSQSLH